MKIYFHIASLGNGGAERVIANLSSEFAMHGHEVTIVTCVDLESEYKVNESVKRYKLFRDDDGKTFLRHIKRIFRLRKMILKDNPDVIISFMADSNIRAIFATLFLQTKSIYSVRNVPEIEYGSSFWFTMITRFLFKCANGGVFQTQAAKEWFPKSIQKKSTIIYNPINNSFFKINRSPIPGKIIACGRLSKEKNHKMLISAFSHVVKIHPKCKLYIYGIGELHDELQRQIEVLNLLENVFLMGRTSCVEETLKEAEIFVLSSDFEGMPNALMEAMAVGVPCISTDCPCGGPRALLESGRNGVLVPVKDERAMTQAIIDLLDDKRRKMTYSENAKAATINFTQEKIYQQWLAYIKSLMREQSLE